MNDPSTSAAPEILESEAERVLTEAQNQGLILRLIGTLAVKKHSPTANQPGFSKTPKDLDLVSYSKLRKKIEKLLTELSYVPYERFNFVHGSRRLIFHHPEAGFQVDVFLDIIEMCHTIDFRNRLELDQPTVPLADLLASKLQIIQLTEKDVTDMIALIRDHELSNDDMDRERINVKHLARMVAGDWGVYKTFTMNLEKLNGHVSDYLPDDAESIRQRIRTISDTFEREPKTGKWRLRAKVGEKVQWYQLPENMKVEPSGN
jgi:hypothetical protein